MPTTIHSLKQVSLQIVYAGPGVGGKTTNLKRFATLFPECQLTEVATAGERTYGGDFLPVGMDPILGFTPRLQLTTVPGQIQYAQTRERLLRNADVVVFVADSLRLRRDANLYALDDLRRVMKVSYGDPETVPIVFQYNKRDLRDILSREQMDRELNPGGAPAVSAVALEGRGVVQTLRKAVELVRGVAVEYLSDGETSAAARVTA